MADDVPERQAPGPSRARLAELFDDLFGVLEHFPVPAEVFAADGSSLFVNSAFTEIFGIDARRIVGELNLLADPYLNDEMGLAGHLQRVFSGDPVVFRDLRVPWQEIDSRQLVHGEVALGIETYQDIACLPLRDAEGTPVYVVALFVTKHVYEVHRAVLSARQCIQARWRDEYDLTAIAEHAGISRHHLSRLFRRFLGTTPYRYYQDVKIERVKQALQDPGLSISEAFADCGVAYTGGYARAFKRVVGVTPTEFRARLASDD
ncbi:MAG: helix-turn-helix domain-containing protein, partial [Propionibacteriaceae bacterium]|nr:helix-turn-helix domain-containing protein [Propionibacteriaceae bacterium]